MTLRVRNVWGQLVEKQTLAPHLNLYTLNLEDYASGVYLIELQEGDILFSEIRPKNKRFAYVYFDVKDYVVSTKLMVLRRTNEIEPIFYYQILKIIVLIY